MNAATMHPPSDVDRMRARVPCLLLTLILTGCADVESPLDPSGPTPQGLHGVREDWCVITLVNHSNATHAFTIVSGNATRNGTIAKDDRLQFDFCEAAAEGAAGGRLDVEGLGWARFAFDRYCWNEPFVISDRGLHPGMKGCT